MTGPLREEPAPPPRRARPGRDPPENRRPDFAALPGGREPADAGRAARSTGRAEVGSRWVDAFNRRDADALVALADPEIEIRPTILVQAAQLYRGHDGVRRWIADQRAATVQPTVRVAEIRVLPDNDLLVLGRIVVHGEEVSPLAVFLRLHEGRVRRLRAYLSDEDILIELGLVPRAGG